MISIIVPVYNIEKYIETCIQSVADQTYSDFELLLINDGSTDSSQEICEKWAERDPRIRVVTKANGGVSSARNLGLDLASGEFLFFLDGDDYLARDCLEQMMEKMTPDIDLVISQWEEVEDDRYKSIVILKRKDYEGVISHAEVIRDIYTSFFYPKVIWGKLYRKKLWENIRFQPMIYSEDTYAMFQVLENSGNIYSIQKPLYCYLQRSTGVSQKRTIGNYEDFLITLDFKYEKALKNYPKYLELCGREYIREAYLLLEMYEEAGQKQKALMLIKKMKFVYQTAGIQKPIFSQKVLALPENILYRWIGIRKIIKTVSYRFS